MTDSAKKRHTELVEQIREYDHAYYNEGRQAVTDFEYDRVYQELVDLERKFPNLVTPSSPTQRVGGSTSQGFKRVKHLLPMLSLDKVEASEHPNRQEEPDTEVRHRQQDEKTLPRLLEFDKAIRKRLDRDKVEYVMEPKVDGVSISVHYRYGKLAFGATRGDGIWGDDITTNIRTIRTIPLELSMKNPPPLLEVRGEAYMATKDFETLNLKLRSSGEKTFPNARNATAGIIRQHDPKLVSERPVRAVFYAIGATEGIEFKTCVDLLESLKKFGLPTQPYWWFCRSIDEVLTHYREDVVCNYEESRDLRTRVAYEIDGIVLKVNQIADWQKIPAKPRSPGYAIVHKPIPWIIPAETTLESITVQVGRTGVLTPVAELDPIFIQGSMISRATLHNEEEIRRKDIRIGDTVVIRKAGMVIPEVVEALKSKRKPGAEIFDLFEYVKGKCPVCNGNIAKEKVSAGTKDEVAWRCQNIAGCPAQQTRRIEYFTGRKALDIESLGGVVAEKLVEHEFAKEPLDLFGLTKEKLAKLNLGTDDQPRNFGEKNAAKVIEARERARRLPLNRWLFALGISGVGEQTAYEVARFHKDFKSIAHSPLLHDAAELGRLRKKILQMSPQSKVNREKSRQERDALRPEWKCLIQQADSVGGRLIESGFAKPAKASGEPRKAVLAVDPIAAESLIDFFESTIGVAVLKKLQELNINPVSDQSVSSATNQASALAGKTFVITGTLSMKRDEAAEMIRKAGASVTGAVSKNTDFLVAGESAGSKLNQARELGVRVISERELMNMMTEQGQSSAEKQQDLL